MLLRLLLLQLRPLRGLLLRQSFRGRIEARLLLLRLLQITYQLLLRLLLLLWLLLQLVLLLVLLLLHWRLLPQNVLLLLLRLLWGQQLPHTPPAFRRHGWNSASCTPTNCGASAPKGAMINGARRRATDI
jgi:hypothetical protein